MNIDVFEDLTTDILDGKTLSTSSFYNQREEIVLFCLEDRNFLSFFYYLFKHMPKQRL